MYGGALPIAKSRKTKKRALTEAEYLDDAPEQPSKKAKKDKKENDAIQENVVGPAVPTIQEVVEDLEPAKILDKKTRSGKTVGSSQSQPQPAQSIPKKKRKQVVRKLKVADYVMEEEDQIEAATDLVTREIKRKKVAEEATLQEADELAQEIGVPTEQLLKESAVEAAQLGIELIENLQQLVVSGEIMQEVILILFTLLKS
jgi:hypothetical protein